MPAKARKNTNAEASSTRDRLIDVGLELMRRHGYGATGLQEILKAADVPKGSFYHHFASKEEFAVAVLDRYVSFEEMHCREVLGSTRQTPLRRLRRYFEDLVGSAGQTSAIQGCLMGSFSLEVAGSSSLIQAALRSNFSVWQSAVSTVLSEAVSRGDLPKSTRTEELAGFILNSWEGALLRSQADRSDVPLHNFLHFLFEKILMHCTPQTARAARK